MASSQHVYDLLVDHAPDDRAVGDLLGRRLRAAGLRPWLPSTSALHFELHGPARHAELRRAQSTARMVVRLLGPSGLQPWRPDGNPDAQAGQEAAPATILVAPGFPDRLQEVRRLFPHAMVLDMRAGFGRSAEWDVLVRAVAAATAHDAGWTGDRLLHHAALKTSVVESYDRIAEQFAARWFDHPPMQPLEMFARMLPRNARVLDAGCGPGHHALFFSAHGHDVVGVDLSEGMLGVARRRVPSVTFARMDIQRLRFARGTFDAVWCAGAAMHVPREELLALLRGFRRVLQPAGIVGLNTQVGRRSEVVEYGDDYRFFEYYRDTTEVVTMVERAGLTVVATDLGTTTRNTHGLDLLLTWATVVSVQSPSSSRVDR